MNKKLGFIEFLKIDVNWLLFLVIFIFQILPTIYKTTRIFFLGNLPDENSYNIASQVLWLNIVYEILLESIVVPLFFVLTSLKNKKEFRQTYTFLTMIIFGIFLIFTIIIFFNIENILRNLNVSNEIFEASSNYIKLEVWGMFFYSIYSYLFLTVTIIRYKKYLLVSFINCLLYTAQMCLFDLFFVTDYNFSLKLSIQGIGINSIITNSVCSLLFIVYFIFKKLWDFSHIKDFYFNRYFMFNYLKLFLISCVEVTVRNVCFYFMVISPINELNQSGIYWVANNFIWSWLLLPITVISIFIKETFILKQNEIKMLLNQIFLYLILISFIVIIWVITTPLNPLFIKEVMGVKDDFIEVNQLVKILIPFYITFAYSAIIDSIFINQGKVNYYCIQSLIVNLTVYPIYFILWKLNKWTPSLNSICIMFGIGMLVHFFVDIPLFYVFIKKYFLKNKAINNFKI